MEICLWSTDLFLSPFSTPHRTEVARGAGARSSGAWGHSPGAWLFTRALGMMQGPLSRPAVLGPSLVRPFQRALWVGDGAEHCGEPAEGGFVDGGSGGGHAASGPGTQCWEHSLRLC